MQIDLDEREVKTIVEILKFSLGSCPIESISDQVAISADAVQELIAKIEKAA